MNKLLILLVTLSLLGGGWYYWTRPVSAPTIEPVSQSVETTSASNTPTLPKVVVRITDNGFEPNNITITKGQTVEFVNAGKDFHWPASDLHPTHEIYSEFDADKPIGPGDSYSFTFEKVGKWNMHDHLHARFRGSITVEWPAD